MAYELTSSGLTVSSASEIRSEIEAALAAELGFAVDTEADAVLGSLVAVLAGRLGELGGALRQVYAERNLNNAQGVQLDALGGYLGVDRKRLAPATFSATVEGTPGTVVPAGSRVSIDDGTGATFVLTDAATVGGSVQVWEAVSPGAKSVAPSSTFTILDSVTGWTGVGTLVSIFNGRDAESDALYRRRIRSSGISGTTSNLAAMLTAVQTVPGVDYVAVLNNPSPVAATVEGVSIEPHSYAVVVFPELDSDNEATLAQTILATGPAGVEPSGDQTEAVSTSDGISRDVNWYYATQTLIDVTIEVDVLRGVGADVGESIADSIRLYFDSVQPGDDLYYLRIYGAVDDVSGTASVTSLTLEEVDASGSVLATIAAPGRDAAASEVFVLNSITVTTSPV